jgi:hypothetical protein
VLSGSGRYREKQRIRSDARAGAAMNFRSSSFSKRYLASLSRLMLACTEARLTFHRGDE